VEKWVITGIHEEKFTDLNHPKNVTLAKAPTISMAYIRIHLQFFFINFAKEQKHPKTGKQSKNITSFAEVKRCRHKHLCYP